MLSWAVFHGSELSLIFGPVPNPIENEFANQLTDFYINFVTDLHPGGKHACNNTLPSSRIADILLCQLHGLSTLWSLSKSCSYSATTSPSSPMVSIPVIPSA